MEQKGAFAQMYLDGKIDLDMPESELEDLLTRVVAWRDVSIANFIATEDSGIDVGDRIILAAKTALYDPAVKLEKDGMIPSLMSAVSARVLAEQHARMEGVSTHSLTSDSSETLALNQ